jgi:hypothetical protein
MQIRRPALSNRSYPFSPPKAAEREALGRVSAYLRRAGNEVESRSLLPTLTCGPPDADLRALHESLRAAAALCDGMAEFAEGGGAPREPDQHARAPWNREATG